LALSEVWPEKDKEFENLPAASDRNDGVYNQRLSNQFGGAAASLPPPMIDERALGVFRPRELRLAWLVQDEVGDLASAPRRQDERKVDECLLPCIEIYLEKYRSGLFGLSAFRVCLCAHAVSPGVRREY
jgi:hypothetical protein